VGTGTNSQIHIRFRDFKLFKKDPGYVVIVMLAGVYQELI
jgi:hypothetical protein